MLIKRLINAIQPKIMTLPELVSSFGYANAAGQTVTTETSKNIATAYRCINILSDDVAKMPLQTFVSRTPGQIERLRANNWAQNIAWLLEVSPNRWMTPFVFKKLLISYLVTCGDSYAWAPTLRPGQRREIYLLDANVTHPVYDLNGDIWYQTIRPDNLMPDYLPDPEVFHLLINSTDGINGRGVIRYARESLGRQMGAYETQGKLYAQGLSPAGVMWMAGELGKEARNKVRDEYSEALSGSRNAGRLAIMDSKVTKFERIAMSPVDAQFLESIQENDTEIANFFGVPLYKLNQGKQSYQSNEQQNLDYLATSLDPYLRQFEEEALLSWLSEEEQNYMYCRFNRDVLLRTDAASRVAALEKRIFSGQLSPNEARQIEDLSSFTGGDSRYIPANMMPIGGQNGT
jgi:HK97 family phage portal protein